jgi:NAD(P)-dependent dehydrogenase (short-subunit alcohol dehydrogenase family)
VSTTIRTARTAVVTGANRGIGREVTRQLARLGFDVVLGTRELEAGTRAAVELSTEGLDVVVKQLDVTSLSQIEALATWLESEYGYLDILVNNVAIHYYTWQRACDADLNVVREAFETNVFGAWRMVTRLLPLLRRSAHPRIVNVSSEGGSLASMSGGIPAYRSSKAALNALTRMLAAELNGDGILVNAVCPGWVATDMGGPGGRPVEDGAASVLWAVEIPDDGPSGGFFRDGRPVPW